MGACRLKEADSADDYGLCADIWLEASLTAHDFIGGDFWRARRSAMAEVYLPASRVVMACPPLEGTPAAFAAVRGDKLEALFVRPAYWGRGLGRLLLSYLFARHDFLHLAVYAENGRAVDFYQKAGFKVESEGLCVHSGARELKMIWPKTGK